MAQSLGLPSPLHRIQEYIRTHRAEFMKGTNLDVKELLRKWTLSDIEEAGTNTTYGYPTRQHYYEDANSLPYLPHIKTPTLFLLSKDDPFLGYVFGGAPHVSTGSHEMF